MSDEQHFIWAARGDTFPARVVGVQADGEATESEGTGSCRVQRLRAWSACAWMGEGRVRPATWEKQAQDRASFWQAVTWSLKRAGRTWCVSWCALRTWGLLGLWERIERGEVRIHGCKAAPGKMPTRQAPPVKDGLAVIEDPPTILIARVAGLPGTLVIVDMRNYGVECYPRDWPLLDRARWVRDTMLRMIAVLRDNGLGSLAYTVGSQAMYTFRRRFITHGIWCHRDPEVLALERAAYVGGRCECFKLGEVKGPIYHVDYRALYPSICASADVPVRLVGRDASRLLAKGQAESSAMAYIADVTLRTDEPAYPYRRGSHVIFPVGRFRTVLCGPELSDAVAHNRIERVHSSVTYEMVPGLRSYVEGIYPLLEHERSGGHPAIVQWLKRLLVCLPGKFGQRDCKWVAAPDVLPPEPWFDWYRLPYAGEIARHRALGSQVEREVNDGWGYNACPAIAAFVTSAGRAALLGAMRCAGRDSTYYVDTDSIFCSCDGYGLLRAAGMVGDGRMGQLRLVAKHESTSFSGIKHYCADGELTCAGLPKGDIEPSGRRGLYWYTQSVQRQIAGHHRPEVALILQRYQREAAYVHGCVGADGVVTPWRLEE